MIITKIIGFLFLTAVAGFFLFLRYLDYSVRRDRQKRLAQLAALPCPRCRVPLGFDAADAARKEGEERMAELMTDARNKGLRLRVVMLWPATCRQCGHRFIFRPDNGELLAESTSERT